MSRDAIIFEDGTTLSTPDDTIIVQCTGYNRSFPIVHDYIKQVSSSAFSWDDPTYPLESNNRYIRALYKCMLPLTDAIPFGSLAFGCLFPVIWNLPTSYAQGLWLAHILANMDIGNQMLPSKESGFAEVREMERQQEARGIDMAKRG